MLKKFTVQNFRRFKEELIFDLSTAKSYEYNTECIKNGIVKTALIYGVNASGKTCLGWALMDIVMHLTDRDTSGLPKRHFINASSSTDIAKFCYSFYLNNKSVIYTYEKDESKKILSEILEIEGHIVIDFKSGQTLITTLKGTESLNKSIPIDSNISALKYIYRNTNLDLRNTESKAFYQLMQFAEKMLWFRNLMDDISYIGLQNGSDHIYQSILNNNNLSDFEAFLNESGVACKLEAVESDGESTIGFKFAKKTIPISSIASTGTKSLSLFYYWWQQLKTQTASLLFIDEFDASYHFKLSNTIVKKLRDLQTQVILTTHNTALLSNELIRPDCGYLIDGKTIEPLYKRTSKELRSAHNLEKIYRSGGFDV